MSHLFRLATLCSSLVVLAGCAVTSVPVQDMVTNREQYLANQYPPSRLRPEVKKMLDAAPAPGGRFKTAKFTAKVDWDDDGKKKLLEITSVVVDAGNGLFQVQTEYSNNGFPYRINNGLYYLGAHWLILQSGFHGEARSNIGDEVKEIKRLDPGLAQPVAGKDYIVEVVTGSLPAVTGSVTSRESCRLVESKAASAVQASLTGQASILECSFYDRASQTTVVSKRQLALLHDLGFALPLGSSSSRSKIGFDYTSALIVR